MASNGELGCQKHNKCPFVHPEDTQAWDLASTSRIPPPRKSLHPSAFDDFGYGEPGFTHRRSRSKKRTNRIERHRSRERNLIESPDLNSAAPYRDYSPSSPSTSMSHRHSRSRSRQRGDEPPVAGSSAGALAPSGKIAPWITSAKPPAPAEPTSSLSLFPPPPPPQPPSFLDDNVPQPADSASLEDRRRAWSQRVQ